MPCLFEFSDYVMDIMNFRRITDCTGYLAPDRFGLVPPKRARSKPMKFCKKIIYIICQYFKQKNLPIRGKVVDLSQKGVQPGTTYLFSLIFLCFTAI